MARYTITDGPSKMDFMLAVFDGNSPRERRMVALRTEDEGNLPFAIDAIRREDGGSENWLFSGCMGITGEEYHGYFSTRTRKGWVEIGLSATESTGDRKANILMEVLRVMYFLPRWARRSGSDPDSVGAMSDRLLESAKGVNRAEDILSLAKAIKEAKDTIEKAIRLGQNEDDQPL